MIADLAVFAGLDAKKNGSAIGAATPRPSFGRDAEAALDRNLEGWSTLRASMESAMARATSRIGVGKLARGDLAYLSRLSIHGHLSSDVLRHKETCVEDAPTERRGVTDVVGIANSTVTSGRFVRDTGAALPPWARWPTVTPSGEPLVSRASDGTAGRPPMVLSGCRAFMHGKAAS